MPEAYSAAHVAMAAPAIPVCITPMSSTSSPILTMPAVSDEARPSPGRPAVAHSISKTYVIMNMGMDRNAIRP